MALRLHAPDNVSIDYIWKWQGPVAGSILSLQRAGGTAGWRLQEMLAGQERDRGGCTVCPWEAHGSFLSCEEMELAFLM